MNDDDLVYCKKKFPDITTELHSILSNGGSWTTTEDCFVHFVAYGNRSAHYVLWISTVDIVGSYSPSDSFCRTDQWIPISKGVTCNLEKTGSHANLAAVCKFYSYK